jgi:hypothetical protein
MVQSPLLFTLVKTKSRRASLVQIQESVNKVRLSIMRVNQSKVQLYLHKLKLRKKI